MHNLICIASARVIASIDQFDLVKFQMIIQVSIYERGRSFLRSNTLVLFRSTFSMSLWIIDKKVSR